MNWDEACQVLGVPTTATPDEIRTQYLYKAQLLHPDKTTSYPEKVRQKAEEELKLINVANSVLKDRKNNTMAMPPKLKVSPRNIRFTDVQAGQQKTTNIKIESVGGAYTKFWMADSPAAWLKVVEVKSTTNDPLPLEAIIEATGSEGTGKDCECILPIRIENETTKTRDEASVKIQIQNGKKESRPRLHLHPIEFRKFAPNIRYEILLIISLPAIIGLAIGAFIRTLIPLWLLLGASILFLTEKWFGNPVRKHKILGIFYRLILNVTMLSSLGFVIWSGVKLFSQQFLRTPLIGSLVFLGEGAFLGWLWVVLRKNSWRFPSMKLTIVALMVTLLVFSFAGVQPFSTFKDKYYSDVMSFFNTSSR
jgi:hypothetical protein